MRSVRAAKHMAAFLFVGFGLVLISGVLGGGEFGSRPRFNDDPRTVGVEFVLLEYDRAGLVSGGDELGWLDGLASGGVVVDAERFAAIREGAKGMAAFSGSGGDTGGGTSQLHTPRLLVQHNEEATLTLKGAGGAFELIVAAHVLDDDLLRVRLRMDAVAGSETETPDRSFGLSTIFTSDGKTALISDQGPAFGGDGRGLLLAVRPSLVVEKP